MKRESPTSISGRGSTDTIAIIIIILHARNPSKNAWLEKLPLF